ncbi:MAG: hypothetical protein HONBIEJF_02154 [Fimbriimonadaceae bacterium]|nr:hypothetical protein [Fimbriimonadaceae bacterium]
MKAFDPDPTLRWLFWMIHPDDELAICAWIRQLVRNGAEVHLAWTHRTEVRELEGRAAAAALGVPDHRLTFLNGRDGHVVEQLDDLLPEIQRTITTINPNRLVTAAFEQGHLDHDATNLLVNAAWRGPVLEVPLYHAYTGWYQTLNRFSRPDGEEIWPLDDEARQFKKRLARTGYPSQTIWRIGVWYEVAHRVQGGSANLLREERMRWQTATDYLKPNHPEPIASRILETEHWRRWVRAVEPFLRANRIGYREGSPGSS